jgi:hypothetical protein
VDVVASVIGGGSEVDDVESVGELARDIVGRVVGAAEARPRRALIQDDEVPLLERPTLVGIQAVA